MHSPQPSTQVPSAGARLNNTEQDSISSENESNIEAEMMPPSDPTTEGDMLSTRKRKRQKDDKKAAAKKASAKKKKKPRRKKRRVVDATWLYDENDLEKPTLADFNNGYGSLHPGSYHTLLRQLTLPAPNNQTEDGEALESQETLNTLSPGLPTHDDDTPDMAIVENGTTDEDEDEDDDDNDDEKPRRKSLNPRILQRANTKRAQPISTEFIQPGDESEDERMDQLEQVPATGESHKREPLSFMNIPVEIRDKIYRELLIANKPINVYGSWKLVYKRNKLNLPVSILSVCQQVHAEASRVLYGENTFLYRLRDPTAGVRDVERLAQDDTEAPEVDEGDSASEWEDERAVVSENRRSSRRKRDAEDAKWDINIEKYSHLFRSIAVEAEHNRYSEETQNSMAKALYAFVEQPTPAASSRTRNKRNRQQPPRQQRKMQRFNIRTLTIRVAPLWNPTGGEDGEGAFTFVDFFKPDSPVLMAVKAVECQFLRVDLLTRYMGKGRTSLTPAESGACRLTMDRRHLNIYNNMLAREKGKIHLKNVTTKGKGKEGVSSDWWESDEVMKERRQLLAEQCLRAIDTLAVHVERECIQRDFQERTTEDLVVGGGIEELFWDDLDDDEDGF